MEPVSGNSAELASESEIGLREYWQILIRRRWWFVSSFLSVLLVATIYTFAQTPIYEATAKLIVQTGTSSSNAQSGDVLGELTGMARARTIETQIELMKSAEVMSPALHAAGLSADASGAPVKIEAVKSTDIIRISCQSPSPQVAARLVNAIGDEYVKTTLQTNRQTASLALSFVDRQLDKARVDLSNAENDLQRFRTGRVITGTNEAAVGLLQRLADQMAQAQQARAAVAGDRAEVAAIRSRLGQTHGMVVSSQTLIRNPVVDDLRKQLSQAEADRAAATMDFAPTSPQVRALDRRLTDIRSRLSGEVEKVVGSEALVSPAEPSLRQQLVAAEVKLLSDRERSAAVERALAQTRAEVGRLPASQRALAELQRTATVSEQRYLSLVTKRQELELANESTVPSARLVERAEVPESPVKPTKQRNLVLAVAFGLMLAFGTILVINYVDNTYSSIGEIERDLEVPVLSVVHRAPPKQRPILNSPMGRSSFAESYRSLRYALRVAGVRRQVGAVVVTSAGVGEGKSTTATNLAIASAESGLRTILVDTDLRRASLHHILGSSNTKGLTDCLVQHGDPVDHLEATQYENLSFLSSGPLPPNPGELLDSDSMSTVVSRLREGSDLVIFDTPPGLMLADARILARLCDGILLVMEMDKTKRPALQRLVQVLGREGSTILGTVVNKVRYAAGSPYYYYYYRRYYTEEDNTE